MKILMATDGSNFSIAALDSVARRPWPADSEVKLISVEELPAVLPNQMSASSLSAMYPASLLEELLQCAQTHAKEAIENASIVLQRSSLRLVNGSATPFGDPRLAILEVAREWKADLIVLGSHGRRGLDRLLMGSVAENIALHAHCSVEVIRVGSD
jgi:nucleotide-binding universal stress UspA family protein